VSIKDLLEKKNRKKSQVLTVIVYLQKCLSVCSQNKSPQDPMLFQTALILNKKGNKGHFKQNIS